MQPETNAGAAVQCMTCKAAAAYVFRGPCCPKGILTSTHPCHSLRCEAFCAAPDLTAAMDTATGKIDRLRKLLGQAVSTKRLVSAHAKRLGTASDTQMLRDQLNSLLAKLKEYLEQGAHVAAAASRAAMDEFSGSEPARLKHITNVQQMEKQLMSIANEYPTLVRNIAAKQEQSPARQSARQQQSQHQHQQEDVPLLDVDQRSSDANSAQPRDDQGQQQMQAQAQRSEVNQLEVQQLGQEIAERDRDIQHLVGSAIEIQQVAQDIAALIDHQATAVDQVAINIENVSHNVDSATNQVARAHARQRKFRIDCVGWVLIALGTITGTWLGLSLF